MDVLDEIIRRAQVHSMGHYCSPTVYVGRKQMMELKIRHAARILLNAEEPFVNTLLGMPLVEVVKEDYLRVA